MKIERIIEHAKALLERENNIQRQQDLLSLIMLLKDDKIKKLEHDLAQLKLNIKYKKVG